MTAPADASAAASSVSKTTSSRDPFADAPGDLPKPPLTKIVATLGPASSDPAVIGRLIEAGVSIFRLNFSHGAATDHEGRVKTVRSVAASMGRVVAILGDLQGPKIRVGKVAEGGVDVNAGCTVLFERGDFTARPPKAGEPVRFACTYPGLVDDVEPGQRLLVNDGAIRMLVIDKTPRAIECSVTQGGLITSGKGINLPQTRLNVEVLGDRDWANVEWAIRNDLDFLAMSFVRTAADVTALLQGIRAIEKRLGVPDLCMSIIAKIELPEAVANIESIVQVADGIMVARGDLGVEMELARVPVVQKKLLATADLYGKPCIVATQMLETMIESPTPTRAEASDVANAIFDGTDAVMLSAETAAGRYPALAVECMRRIAENAEEYLRSLPPRPSPPQKLIESRYGTAALAHGVWTIAQDLAVKFIVVWSQRGGGARYLSQNGFQIPIVAITSDDRAARQMQLLRGVTPVHMPVPEDLDHFTRIVDAYLLETGWARQGDACVLVAGMPIGTARATNSLALHRIGDPASGFAGRRT